jgi:hypothetical protein
MFFHRYEPTLADVAVEGGLIGLVCFFALAGLLWLGRWVVRPALVVCKPGGCGRGKAGRMLRCGGCHHRALPWLLALVRSTGAALRSFTRHFRPCFRWA